MSKLCDEIVFPIPQESIRFIYTPTPEGSAHIILKDVATALYDNTKLS